MLELIVQGVPIGTNPGLLYILWALLNGSFLSSRRAIFPALRRSGFDAETYKIRSPKSDAASSTASSAVWLP